MDVAVGDTVVVGDGGRGKMYIRDRFSVDLLTGAAAKLTGLRPTAADALFVELNQIKGHIRIRLEPFANLRMILETDLASLEASTTGTEFIVCHNPTKVTCVAVVSGELEFTDRDETITLRAGEAGYVVKGQPLSSPICVPAEQLQAWWESRLSSPDAPALSDVVNSLPQQGCVASVDADSGLATPPAVSPGMTPAPLITDSIAVVTNTSLPASTGMVKVEGATYTLGSGTGDDFHLPAFQRAVGTFWIDTTEITNAQYQAFVDATGYSAPTAWPGRPQHPVKGLDYAAASNFCTWAGKRLPTELEWEIAARGPGATPPAYPWGDDPSAGGEAGSLPPIDTYEVGTVAFNRSPFGAFDMAGNVWEWVGETYGAVAAGQQVIRGGRHGLIKDMAYRQQVAPDGGRFLQFAGVRCAATTVKE